MSEDDKDSEPEFEEMMEVMQERMEEYAEQADEEDWEPPEDLQADSAVPALVYTGVFVVLVSSLLGTIAMGLLYAVNSLSGWLQIGGVVAVIIVILIFLNSLRNAA